MKRTRCQHPRLKSFTFSSGEVMSLCPDCSFGEGHTDSRYTKRRGPKEPEPEQDEIETSETELPEPDLEELTETGLPAFSVLDDENDALSVIESDAESDSDENADEEAEVLEEIEESA